MLTTIMKIQCGAVIARSNITYCMHHCRNWGRISNRIWIHKIHPIPRPNRRAMGCILQFFLENWPRYNGTALYMYMVLCYCLLVIKWNNKSSMNNSTTKFDVDYFASVTLDALLECVFFRTNCCRKYAREGIVYYTTMPPILTILTRHKIAIECYLRWS